MNREQELHTALNAVRRAALVCRSVQAAITADVLEKKDKSPVTVADFASQAIICRQLQNDFPDDPVIAEEGADELRSDSSGFLQRVVKHCASVGVEGSGEDVCDWIDHGSLNEYRDRFWTLDPIDGTKGFLRGEQYAISLSLIVGGDIQIGVLGCPNLPLTAANDAGPRGVLAWAVAGKGAWSQPIDQPEAEPQPVKVSSTTDLGDARFCESVESGHSSHGWSGKIASQLAISNEPFRIDSQCKYFAVGSGNADIYLRLPTRADYQEKIWDHAGGVLIVREAGGVVTDIHGAAPDFSQGTTLAKNQGMVVTNGQFHDQVIQAVQDNAPD